MYDPLETDISYQYLELLADKCNKLRFALLGGWAAFFYVNKEYKKAFGHEYIKSRDIDIFIDRRDEKEFSKIIAELGFVPSAYKFRYELIFDRVSEEAISKEKAKNIPIYNLIYVFLDVFSDAETKLGSWAIKDLKQAEKTVIEGKPLVDAATLLKLKSTSLFEREKLDKGLKDSCDIYALLVYSSRKIKLDEIAKKAIEHIIARDDLCDFIAENVLGDSLKASLVKRTLMNLT